MVRSKTLHVAVMPDGEICGARTTQSVSRNGLQGQTGGSLDELSRLLSKRNVELLSLIQNSKPQSVSELSRLSGRPKASLMLTLRRLEKLGIISFRTRGQQTRCKVPTLVCDRVMIEVALCRSGEQ